MTQPTPSMSDAEQRIADLMYDTLGVRQGWRWYARHIDDAPGWYRVWEQGPNPADILIGGIQLTDEDCRLVALSSNPAAHDWQQVIAVLTDPDTAGLTGSRLSDEIFRRTQGARHSS